MSERAASKTTILCVVISFPNGVDLTRLYLTDSPAPLQMEYMGSVRTFEPDRFLEYQAVERNGGLEEESAKLVTSSQWGFAARALRGDTMEPLTFEVLEVIAERVFDTVPSQVSVIHWDKGKIASVSNAEGADVGSCVWTVLNAKVEMDRVVNTRATENCPDRLGGGKVCAFDLEANKSSVTIVGFVDRTITVTGLRSEPTGYWEDGFVQIGGLELKIRAVDGADLTLYSPLPEDMRISIAGGATFPARVYPGCSGSVAECSMYNQLSRFWGLAIAGETRNPLFQLPR